jgi:hypothetical protein
MIRSTDLNLRRLAEYASRAGAELPYEISQSMFEDQGHAGRRDLALLQNWIRHWHGIDPEVQAILADYLGAGSPADVYTALLEGLLLHLGAWTASNYETPQQVKALCRAQGVAL